MRTAGIASGVAAWGRRWNAMRATWCVAGALAAAGVACSGAGARSVESGAADQAAAALRPVTLPDLSASEPSVQEQLRAGFAALTRVTDTMGASPSERANAYGEMGRLLLAARFAEAAEASFLQAQASAREDFRWPYYLGHIYKAKGLQPQALEAFQRAHDLNPGDAPAQVWLAEMMLAGGRPDAAKPLFEKALAAKGASLAARYGLGRAALAQRDYMSAVDRLEAALALSPNAASVHYPLALAYRGLGDTANAERHARLAGESALSPPDPLMDDVRMLLKSPVSYELAGTRALNQGDWAAAMEPFRKGLELDPRNTALRHKLGTAMFLSGDAAGARAAFEAIVRDDPAFAKAQYSLGVLVGGQGQTREAEKHLSAAIARDPAYVEAHVSLAELYRSAGRLREAVAEYDRALAIDPKLPEAALGRALTLIRLERYAEAATRLQEARAVHPDAPWIAHALARVLAAAPDPRVRDGGQALAVLQALPPADQRIDFGESMSMALAEGGRFDEAAAWQRGAIDLASKAGRAGQTALMEARLRLYESGKPSRAPWAPEELQ